MSNAIAANAEYSILGSKHVNISPRELTPVITKTCKKYANSRISKFNIRLGIAKNYGVTRPHLRKITRNILEMVKFSAKDLKELISMLWHIENNEERTISLMLMAEALKRYEYKYDIFSVKELKTIVNSIETWDLADFFAVEILGRYLAYEPRNFGELKKWSKDKNPWARRIYAVSSWGYFTNSKNGGKRRTEKALSMFNNVITDSVKPVKTGAEWALRNICKRDWQNCFPFYKFWTKIKDPNVAWIIKKSSIFMPSKFRKKILSKISF